jgi:hypothetical protein
MKTTKNKSKKEPYAKSLRVDRKVLEVAKRVYTYGIEPSYPEIHNLDLGNGYWSIEKACFSAGLALGLMLARDGHGNFEDAE